VVPGMSQGPAFSVLPESEPSLGLPSDCELGMATRRVSGMGVRFLPSPHREAEPLLTRPCRARHESTNGPVCRESLPYPECPRDHSPGGGSVAHDATTDRDPQPPERGLGHGAARPPVSRPPRNSLASASGRWDDLRLAGSGGLPTDVDQKMSRPHAVHRCRTLR
jgi:hypothetical protein